MGNWVFAVLPQSIRVGDGSRTVDAAPHRAVSEDVPPAVARAMNAQITTERTNYGRVRLNASQLRDNACNAVNATVRPTFSEQRTHVTRNVVTRNT